MVTDLTIIEGAAILQACATIKTHPAGTKILAKLDEFLKNDMIVYDPSLNPNVWGESFENWAWGRIRLNVKIKGDPESVAVTMGHELVHLALTGIGDFDEEIKCREFDAIFAVEITGGFSYPDPAHPLVIKTAKLTVGNKQWPYCQDTSNLYGVDQLVDKVLAIHHYDKKLTADWVIKHINDYGGLRNRWATSLGKYAGALANSTKRSFHYASQFLQILNAIPASYWTQAKPALGDFGRFKTVVSEIAGLSGINATATITALEARFGEKLR